ncbi:hypothetical protein [Acidicapsa acidisoli]|uniref:hypothetical protein n=1 Tax=Acidicapsa acidisoli TaxID=1615681 RepID=UPI0021E08425|nr:hypothetical protein [Acidicapsa acidisoli]
MKTTVLCISFILFVTVLFGVFRTILERRCPFVREFNDTTWQAYIVLMVVAAGLFAWARLDLHVESVEIAGVKATVGQLQQNVQSLSQQMEVFFKNKRIETFDKTNWQRVRTVSNPGQSLMLEVTLDEEPIPGSVEVFEGVLLMPEQKYSIEGRVVRFPANTNKPVNGLTIKYYPRITQH